MFRFKPALSAKIYSNNAAETVKNFALIKFPVLCSPKMDGIRLLEYNMGFVTRSLKAVRNHHVRELTREFAAVSKEAGMRGGDGEICVGEPHHPNVMQHTTSGIMSGEGQPDFGLYMFDSYQNSNEPFVKRLESVRRLHDKLGERFPWFKYVDHVLIHNMEQLIEYENLCLAAGYEGIMLRDPAGRYKMGRSTMREGILMALKRFTDDEAIILEHHEELENTNEGIENALGHLERSSHAENLVPKGRMGTMLAKSLRFEKTFFLGGGIGVTHGFRQAIWDNPQDFQWKLCVYSYQDIGIRERPRLSKWKSWRSWDDIDAERKAALLHQAGQWIFSGKGRSALNGPPPG